MLTRNRFGRLCQAAALGALLTVLTGPVAAQAEPTGGGDCSGPDCDVWGEEPANPGGGGGDGGDSGGSGCHYNGQSVPCTIDGLGWFDSSNGCYYILTAVPPFGDPHAGEEGNWYTVTCGMYNGGPVVTVDTWVPGGPLQPPPNPEDLARRALATITLKGAAIRLAPKTNGAGLVHLPVWMWTTVTASTWGPNTASASQGGLTVTITASVERIVWNMGDGHTVTCTSPGTPFTRGNGGKSSPTCGHTYLQASRDQPRGKYRVTATSYWRVDWSGGGATGVIDQTRTSSSTAKIDDLQAVNR